MTERDSHPGELLPELALGVLPESDAVGVRAHLADCAECRAEYEEMSRVARLLPLAAEEFAPCPALKDVVFSRIAADAQIPADVPSNVVPFRSQLPLRWVAGLAAGVVALAVAGGVAGFSLRGGGGNGDLKETAGLQARALEAAAQGTLKVARGEQDGASASVLITPGSAQVFAYVDGLPALPDGKAYQAWFTKDGRTFEPSAVFTTGTGSTWLPAAADADSYAAMGLTIEDSDGASVPSSAPFVVVDFTKSVRAR